MSKAKFSSGGFPQRCKTFFAMKGTVQPRCSCSSCWEFFFHKNPGKVSAAALALKQFGPATLIKAQGAPYATEREVLESWEIKAGLRKSRSDYKDVAERRGRKFLKHLVQWLQDNPHDQISARTLAKHKAELAAGKISSAEVAA